MASGKYAYKESGDISGHRNIDWFEKHIFSFAFWNSFKGRLLDIGCGNGRINSLFKNYFDYIYCIDSGTSVFDMFNYDNVFFIKKGIEHLKTNRKFDVITFMLSFYSIEEKEKILKKCVNMLSDNGSIVIVDGILEVRSKSRAGYYTIELIKDIVNKFNMKLVIHTTPIKDTTESIIFILTK